MNNKTRAVVTVIGRDSVGILAAVSSVCAESSCNVIEVTQSVLEELFCMIMIIDMEKSTHTVDEIRQDIEKRVPAMQVHVMHEDIFNSMHRI